MRNKIRAGTALSREETAREAQLSRKAAAARGVVGANTWSSNDEAALQTAQNNAQTANARLSSASATHSAAQRIYSKRANGLLRRAAFLTSDMRFKKARREADAKHTEQKELGRLLQESEGFQKSYAGITPGMYEGQRSRPFDVLLTRLKLLVTSKAMKSASKWPPILAILAQLKSPLVVKK